MSARYRIALTPERASGAECATWLYMVEVEIGVMCRSASTALTPAEELVAELKAWERRDRGRGRWSQVMEPGERILRGDRDRAPGPGTSSHVCAPDIGCLRAQIAGGANPLRQ